MAAGTTFRVRLLHAAIIEGRRWVAGAELEADAATARRMIEAGSARLASDGDLARLIRQVGGQRPRIMTR
ncbi:MAG: hypothetical protein IPI03_02625 [Rubrivivax sp.]|jgi:hypothetical protein|nr:hypothetical protein [Rubrivivax sp.]MBK7260837.1 hypothetical protein [Rubrivivax sp.]MBK8527226.1 hypothetical protein [Rubrivivax sp.]